MTSLPAWEEVLSLGGGNCLSCCLPACLFEWPEKTLSYLPHGEGGCLPDCLPEMPLNCFLPQKEGECLPGKL